MNGSSKVDLKCKLFEDLAQARPELRNKIHAANSNIVRTGQGFDNESTNNIHHETSSLYLSLSHP